MPKKKLILYASESMDSNKKEERDEHCLVRMAAATRKNMEFDNQVELSSSAGKTVMLDIFHAFRGDVQRVKKMVNDGEVSPEEIKRIGFVTTDTFNKITGGNKQIKNIWISDTLEGNVLGTDPEFLLFDGDGNVIRANQVLSKEGILGCDGAMAEIRPDPAATTTGLIKNISDIFSNKRITQTIDQYRWMTACYHKDNVRDYPVGGHIHVGNPVNVSKMPAPSRRLLFCSINKIMDELLAIPLIKLDGAENGSARRINCNMGLSHGNHRGYGYFGEWRPCRVGGEEHFEHRTLSGMWMLHPSVSKALLGTAKAIVDEVFRKASAKGFEMSYVFPKKFEGVNIWQPEFDAWDQIPLVKDMKCVKTSDKMIELLNKSSPVSIPKSYLKSWYDKLKNMSTYRENAKYIDALYEILKISTKELTGWDKQIQKNWLEGKQFLVQV